MLSDPSVELLKSLPDTPLYLLAMVVLLIVTTVALTIGEDWIGLTSFLLLAVMALGYGAVQTPDDMP